MEGGRGLGSAEAGRVTDMLGLSVFVQDVQLVLMPSVLLGLFDLSSMSEQHGKASNTPAHAFCHDNCLPIMTLNLPIMT